MQFRDYDFFFTQKLTDATHRSVHAILQNCGTLFVQAHSGSNQVSDGLWT